jgi:hypothetical protein
MEDLCIVKEKGQVLSGKENNGSASGASLTEHLVDEERTRAIWQVTNWPGLWLWAPPPSKIGDFYGWPDEWAGKRSIFNSKTIF